MTDQEEYSISTNSGDNHYMAFISYRHADNTEEDQKWATWLHQQLEVYDVPHELIGTTNFRGETIPERIYPVFRDEVSLPANADLSEAIEDALDRSQFLVVLCSPRAVQSKYVNEEILHFKQTGKADRIMAALLLGEPNASIDEAKIEDPEHARTMECFPEALQYKLGNNKALDKNSQTEPIAANFRLPDGSKGVTNPAVYKQKLLEQGRNKKDAERLAQAYEEQINTAKLKIVAGILGVELEQLIKRDKIHQLNKAREQARKARRFTAIVSGLLILAIGAGGLAFVQYQQAQANFKRAEDLLGTVRTSINFLNFDARDAFKNYLPVNERERISGEIDQLAELLADYGGNGAEDIRLRAVAYMQKADLILRNSQMNPKEALPLYQQAHKLFEGLARQYPDISQFQRDLSISYNKLGNIELRLGQTQAALDHYQADLGITKTLAEKDPDNSQFQSDLSISYIKLGNIELRLGQTQAALNHYQAALEITKTLAEKDPDNSKFQRDLSISYNKLGNIELRLGQTQAALDHYQATLGIAKTLTEKDPDNSQFQSDLSVSYNKLGDIQLRLGHTQAALDHYQAALGIRKTLTEKDPDNSQFQRDLASSYERLGDIELRLGQTQAALDHYQAGLEIIKTLAEKDPDNSEFQRDLSISHNKLGDIELRLGQTQTALDHYQAGLEIRKTLTEKDPDNSEFQRDLAVSHDRLGNIELRLSQTQAALDHYQAVLETTKTLAEKDPDNTQFQSDLWVSHNKLGDIKLRLGQTQAALDHYQAGLEIIKTLAEKDPDNSQFQSDLSTSYERLGNIELRLGQTQAALDHYQASLEITKTLAEKDPDNSEFQRDIFVSYWKFARVYEKDNKLDQSQGYVQLALDQLLMMQEKGILAKDDEQYIAEAENFLSE